MAIPSDPRLPETDPTIDPAASDVAGRDYQVVAVFENWERARAARDRLAEEGIPTSAMDIINREAEPGYSNVEYERSEEGFWGAIKRFFVPGEHEAGYYEAVRRGQAVLVVRPNYDQHDRVVQILEGYDPIDFDRQEETWRQTGWTGTSPVAAGMSEAGHGALGRSGLDRPASEPADVAASAASLKAADRVGATPAAPVAGRTVPAGVGARDEAIPVVEETVRVGKRLVDRGGVRVRSYVTERPVEENVTLHEERVDVERRPVDRAAGTLPEDAFRERTIEVSATGEEAVVQKDARVVEEVVVRKDAADRTETVRDTTRKTEVEVEDTRTGEKKGPAR